MPTLIALLRAVNVGGAGSVNTGNPMATAVVRGILWYRSGERDATRAQRQRPVTRPT